MINRGVEISIDGDVIRTKDFAWNLNVNVSYNKNKLVELYNGVQEYVNSTTGLKYVVGHPVHEFFLNRYAGVNPANGDALWYTKDGEITTEFREEDKVMTGKTFDSPWAGGFGTTFSWKGLSLSAQFSWMADRWVMNNDHFFEESNWIVQRIQPVKTPVVRSLEKAGMTLQTFPVTEWLPNSMTVSSKTLHSFA